MSQRGAGDAPGAGGPALAGSSRASPPSALWRLFEPGRNGDPHPRDGADDSLRVVFLSGDEASWRDQLAEAADGLAPGGRLIATCNRGAVLALRRLLGGRSGEQARSGPSARDVIRALRSTGLGLEAAYRLWPSAEHPRIAVAWSAPRTMRWMQRAGMMGGGARVWVRLLARSSLLTKVVELSSPGVAFVARKGRDDR